MDVSLDLTPLTALSPLDGRYHRQTAPLAPYFSEYALIRYRLRVEVEYLIAFSRLPAITAPALTDAQVAELRASYEQFSVEVAAEIKALERQTNHDVKAVEYWLKQRLRSLTDDPRLLEAVHFGLTSQDINNTAQPLALQEALRAVYIPALEGVLLTLHQMARDWAAIPMLARTHGQPASPVTLGREIGVFVGRLERQLASLRLLPLPAKFGGATGGMNAHWLAYPQVDWHQFADQFVNHTLGLQRTFPTTQIEPYDGLAAVFDNLRRIHVILLDLCRDLWQYISLNYFKLKTFAGEVGSSAMPHKVNPIDFENAEGNLGLANAILDHLSNKLPVSRLQRDLTDSTVLRNVGVPLGHGLLALSSLQKGLGKLELDAPTVAADLDAHWEVLAEAVQTLLRREGYVGAYEALRDFSRTGQALGAEGLQAFVETLQIADSVKAEIRSLRPETYLGH
jgi:adenylosuccinate lyase